MITTRAHSRRALMLMSHSHLEHIEHILFLHIRMYTVYMHVHSYLFLLIKAHLERILFLHIRMQSLDMDIYVWFFFWNTFTPEPVQAHSHLESVHVQVIFCIQYKIRIFF